MPGEAWQVVRFSLAAALAPLVVDKGSIAVSGVSLTVSNVGTDAPGTDASQHWFEVSLIPETLAVTTLGTLAVGDRVNIETDILARHVERLVALGHTAAAPAPAAAPTPGTPSTPPIPTSSTARSDS